LVLFKEYDEIFKKKRLIEGNKFTINNDYSVLKNRIMNRNQTETNKGAKKKPTGLPRQSLKMQPSAYQDPMETLPQVVPHQRRPTSDLQDPAH